MAKRVPPKIHGMHPYLVGTVWRDTRGSTVYTSKRSQKAITLHHSTMEKNPLSICTRVLLYGRHRPPVEMIPTIEFIQQMKNDTDSGLCHWCQTAMYSQYIKKEEIRSEVKFDNWTEDQLGMLFLRLTANYHA